ncbi:hypothetical protein R1sor_025675 [Riccia sorocarpa]|uniref:Uncharacterized protein n=1 Tax=Riccia sorocarpa TaxID=122646 RepID=A0ABD3GC07_9MARC
MWEAWYRRLVDLLDEEEEQLVPWEFKKIPEAESKPVEKAYNKLLSVITVPNENRLNAEEKILGYYETEEQTDQKDTYQRCRCNHQQNEKMGGHCRGVARKQTTVEDNLETQACAEGELPFVEYLYEDSPYE